MNRLKGLKLKFDVTDNPELSEAIQKRVFELGGHWLTSNTDIMLPQPGGSYHVFCVIDGVIRSGGLSGDPATLNDLYHLPEIHTITIDGKYIELSAESFAELKKQLV